MNAGSIENLKECTAKHRSIGTQTDLRLAIRCTCERARDKSKDAKKTVKAPLTKGVTRTGVNDLAGSSNVAKNKPKTRTTAAAAAAAVAAEEKVIVCYNVSDTPSENSKPKRKPRAMRRNLRRKSWSDVGSVGSSSHDRQLRIQQKQPTNGAPPPDTGDHADKLKRNHGNNAQRNTNVGNKPDDETSRKEPGHFTRELRSARAGAKGTTGSPTTGSGGVNNHTARNINANARPLDWLVSGQMEQSRAGHALMVNRVQSQPQEQSNQRHPASKLIEAYTKLTIGKLLEEQNKSALTNTGTPLSPTLVNSNHEKPTDQRRAGGQAGGGRKIIYLTNRDQYELKAKLLIDAVPFRMPGT